MIMRYLFIPSIILLASVASDAHLSQHRPHDEINSIDVREGLEDLPDLVGFLTNYVCPKDTKLFEQTQVEDMTADELVTYLLSIRDYVDKTLVQVGERFPETQALMVNRGRVEHGGGVMSTVVVITTTITQVRGRVTLTKTITSIMKRPVVQATSTPGGLEPSLMFGIPASVTTSSTGSDCTASETLVQRSENSPAPTVKTSTTSSSKPSQTLGSPDSSSTSNSSYHPASSVATTKSGASSSSSKLPASSTASTKSSASNNTPSTTPSSSQSTAPIKGNSLATTAASTYVFNPSATNNVAVYFGQTAITGSTSLLAQCADPSIDIVILAFVIGQLNGGPYPTVNFGAACGGQTAAMQASAPGLLSCPALASDIANCQGTYGKKVLLSIGGATAGVTFANASQATAFGDVLWKLFGPAGNVDINLRPFGTVDIDGFDIDNENTHPAYYLNLAQNLRAHYTSVRSKVHYLTSAPQCPYPDASNPTPMLLLCDLVFVQFYNNPACEIGSSGFIASVKTWSNALAASTLSRKTRLYVGAPGWSGGGNSAYAAIGSPQGIVKIEQSVKTLGLSNFGGGMFWDGPEGRANVGNGKSIITWAKSGLT